MNTNTSYERCSELFGDVLQTNHFRKAVWSCTFVHEGTVAFLADARGAMLVLQRVRDLVVQGTWLTSCRQRVDKIESMLRDESKNEVGDMSLEGFDARKELAEIKRNHGQCKVDKRAETSRLQGSGKAARDANGDTSHEHVDADGDISHEHDDDERISTEGSRVNRHTKKPDTHKKCANIMCRDPKNKRFVCVPRQSRAAGQDWTEYWGKTLCFRCYNWYRIHGSLNNDAVVGERARNQDQSTASSHAHRKTDMKLTSRRSRSLDQVERSMEGQQSARKRSLEPTMPEERQKLSKQCANMHCKGPRDRFIHVAVQCQAGGQDWKQHWDKYLCFTCYNRYRQRGIFETGTSTTDKGDPDKDQRTEAVRSDQSANASTKEISASKEQPEKCSESLEEQGTRAEKASHGLRDRAGGKTKHSKDEACESAPSAESMSCTSGGRKQVLPAEQPASHSSQDVPMKLCTRSFVRLPVEGLEGRIFITRISTSNKLEVLFR